MEIDRKLFEKAIAITNTDYKEIGLPDNKYYVTNSAIECLIEDLLYEVDYLKEKIEDMEQDIQDNYRPLTNKDIYED